MQRTKIEWTTHTWNPAVGCSKVSEGCANCYAKAMVRRFRDMTGMTPAPDPDTVGWDGQAHFKPERLREPFRLRPGKERPHRIFACSMSDLFHESLSDEQIAAMFGVMAATQHQYFVLTKRPARAVEWFGRISRQECDENTECGFHLLQQAEPEMDGPIHCKYGPAPEGHPWPLPNVAIGVSVENQKVADERVPLLLRIPAAKRFVSVEPMLGPVWLRMGMDYNWLSPVQTTLGPERKGLNWVICGAETGPGKREFQEGWAVDLMHQCKRSDVPFFFKKDGYGKPTLCGTQYREWIK